MHYGVAYESVHMLAGGHMIKVWVWNFGVGKGKTKIEHII